MLLSFRITKQARSQVVLWGGAIQHGDGPNEARRASLGGGGGRGEPWLSETELRSKFAIGRSSLQTR